MQIKIFNQNQLSILRTINPLLKEYKIPRMVLHEIGYILEFEKASDNDYVILFLKPLRNDLIDILDRLHLYTEEVEYSENNFHTIEVKGKKHPMKKNRIWSWYDISIPAEERTIFVVYSMKKKNLEKKGGFYFLRIKRWGKQSRRIKNVVTCGEPEIVLMELETENLNPDVYRYRTEWGINIVYYIFNFQLMEELIFQPIYLNNSDIFYFGMTENELFKKVLKNTIIMTQPRIMLFPEYLKDLERVCERSLIPVIRELISVMVKIENKSKQLWCVSNILGERGAVGGFYKRLLRKFCMTHNCNRLLVGFSNNDYALLTMVNENTVMAIRQLIDGVGSVRSDTGKITQRKLLIYDYGKDSLEEFEEMDFV